MNYYHNIKIDCLRSYFLKGFYKIKLGMKFVLKFIVFLTVVLINNNAFAADQTINSNTSLNSDNTGRVTFGADNITLDVGNSSNTILDKPSRTIQGENTNNNTLNIFSGSTVKTSTNDRVIYIHGADGFTINNYGTVESSRGVSISMDGTTNTSINNFSNGVLETLRGNIAANSGTNSNNTIENYGKIYSTGTSGSSTYDVIDFNASSASNTITNHAGGEIYTMGEGVTIRLGASSTLVNSGVIAIYSDPTDIAIQTSGDNNTITLKDKSILIGKIKIGAGTSGNKLQLNHGIGSTYFYETEGDFDLEDLDGNQIVKGSAGSVNQGAQETIDEMLGYKTRQIRNSIDRYKDEKHFYDTSSDWGETYYYSIKRNSSVKNRTSEYEFDAYGVNLFKSLEDTRLIVSYEKGQQDFGSDFKISKHHVLIGFLYDDHHKYNNTIEETFILAGLTSNNSKRTILTNTTLTGKLDVTDQYNSYEIMLGKKFIKSDNKNEKTNFSPNFGYTINYLNLPSHEESHYFKWDKKNLVQFSGYVTDEYIKKFETFDSSFSFGWDLDFRTIIAGKKQQYKINETSATYSQKENLVKELTLGTSLGYKSNISKNSYFYANIDASYSSQFAYKFGGSIGIKAAF